jgi:hypothetical protein
MIFHGDGYSGEPRSQMHKLYLETLSANWWKESGRLAHWEAFLSHIPTSGPGYEMVDRASIADFVIEHGATTADHGWAAALKPPGKNGDVPRVVWSGEDRPVGREDGFYCSLPRRLFDPSRHAAICYQVPYNDLIEEFPLDDAKLSFGFVGGLTAGVRTRIVRTFAASAADHRAFIRETSFGATFWNDISRAPDAEKRSYAEFMRASRFILCPRGQGTCSIRLFETLQAGRVPVIISDDYVLPTLRGPTQWQDAALFVGERELDRLVDRIEEATPRWPMMAHAARAIWEENFAPENIMAFISHNLDRMAPTIRAGATNQVARTAVLLSYLVEQRARPTLGAVRRVLMSR